MIRNRNTGEFTLQMGPVITTQGTRSTFAVTGNGVMETITAPFAGTISAIVAAFGQMGTDGTGSPTQDLRVDVQINGTTVFAANTNPIVWAHAGQTGAATGSPATSYGPLASNPPSFNQGDEISINALQVLNGTSPTQPKDLCVWLSLAPATQTAKQTSLGSLAPGLF